MTKAELFSILDEKIKSNGAGAITASVLNGILKDIMTHDILTMESHLELEEGSNEYTYGEDFREEFLTKIFGKTLVPVSEIFDNIKELSNMKVIAPVMKYGSEVFETFFVRASVCPDDDVCSLFLFTSDRELCILDV